MPGRSSPTPIQTSSAPVRFVVASDEWRRHSVSDPEQPSESNSLTPEQRLEPTNADILRASIETIHDMETLQACVGYENAHQQRTHILERLAHRARQLRSNDD